ncbi:MAG: HAMP domain-containing protein [Streptosporangiales bacterium]|nr:HAMP domain-containing protein [Streptosporangiales bacterium]
MRVSARARILSWILLVVAVALLLSILATRAILGAGLTDRLDHELQQEVGEFRAYAEQTPAADVDELMAGYLQEKLPDRYETFFSVVGTTAARRTSHDPPARLDQDEALVREVAQIRTPSYGWADSSAGRVRYAAIPVRLAGDARLGHLVVAEFYDLAAQENSATLRVLTLVGFGTLAVAGVIGWVAAGRVLAPVRLLRQTAERVRDDDLTGRIDVKGNDDIAQLARTFNHMLDRLEQGFATQRRFLDDAGHELRTPITVVRGHLELMGDDPAEREETLALVNDELSRMRRIVEDLLLLARSDQPNFLSPTDVELADLTVGVVAKSRALGERRWGVDQVGERIVVADGQRLTQALMQLTANAVAYTEVGDGISVGSAVRDGRVLLWVRDTGAGLPPGDHEQLFERFTRGGGGRGSGAGLGLAIVQSIAKAHHGVVRVDSRPGAGATFTLDLPLRESGDQPTVPLDVVVEGGDRG